MTHTAVILYCYYCVPFQIKIQRGAQSPLLSHYVPTSRRCQGDEERKLPVRPPEQQKTHCDSRPQRSTYSTQIHHPSAQFSRGALERSSIWIWLWAPLLLWPDSVPYRNKGHLNKCYSSEGNASKVLYGFSSWILIMCECIVCCLGHVFVIFSLPIFTTLYLKIFNSFPASIFWLFSQNVDDARNFFLLWTLYCQIKAVSETTAYTLN